MTTGLRFDEAEHRYFLDGVELPSVTQVLALAGMTDWTYCGEYARERGSIVHRAVHLELTTGLDWSTLPDALHPYVSAELQAIEDLRAEIVASEVRVFSRLHGYAGTLDRIARIEGRLVLWDTKTGPCVPAYGPQTAAYVEAVQEMAPDFLGGETISRRYALRLNPDGSYEFIPFTRRDDFATFHAALRVAMWKRERGLAA